MALFLMAKCCRCLEEKSNDSFYLDKRSKSGLNSMCKDCYREYNNGRYRPKKKPKNLARHYIYIAKVEGEIVYVGKGVGDRYKHLISGKSHVYKANEFFFLGKQFEIDILEYFESKHEALKRESQMIAELNPDWNSNKGSIHNTTGYIGVSFDPSATNPWRCRFRYEGIRISNGNYQTELEAALAHDQYVKDNNLKRPLNFPEED